MNGHQSGLAISTSVDLDVARLPNSLASIVQARRTQRRVGVIGSIAGAEGFGPRPGADLVVIAANGSTVGSLPAGAVQREIMPMLTR